MYIKMTLSNQSDATPSMPMSLFKGKGSLLKKQASKVTRACRLMLQSEIDACLTNHTGILKEGRRQQLTYAVL